MYTSICMYKKCINIYTYIYVCYKRIYIYILCMLIIPQTSVALGVLAWELASVASTRPPVASRGPPVAFRGLRWPPVDDGMDNIYGSKVSNTTLGQKLYFPVYGPRNFLSGHAQTLPPGYRNLQALLDRLRGSRAQKKTTFKKELGSQSM